MLISMFLYRVLFLHALLYHFPSVTVASFTQVTSLGGRAAANSEAVGVALSPDGKHAYVVGTTVPLERTGASQFGEPTGPQLRDADIFIARIDLATKNVAWTFRYGTLKEDKAESVLLSSSGQYLYVAGSTFGSFLNGPPNKGLADGFIEKYELRADGALARWKSPLVLRTAGTDVIMQLAESPDDANLIFGVGYTSGPLFKGSTGGVSDAFMFSFNATDGHVLHKVQFGGMTADRGMALAVAPGAGAPVFAGVETEQLIGDVLVANFHLYKFSKKLEKRGDIMLTSFATEQVTGIRLHPGMSDNVFVEGYSKLDETNREDIFVKRININVTSDIDIGSTVVKVRDMRKPDYTQRIGATAYDYVSSGAVHLQSGRWLIGGYSTGAFDASSRAMASNMAPFVASVSPVNGDLLDMAHFKDVPQGTWANLKAMAVAKDGKSIVFVGKQLNKTTSLFFAHVGIFTISDAWQKQIPLKDPGESPSPTPTVEEKPFPIFIVAGAAGGGGLVILLCTILMLCVAHRKGPS